MWAAGLLAAALVLVGGPANEAGGPRTVFVGSFTSEEEAGIYSCEWDAERGELADARLEVEAVQASYLTLSEDKQLLFTFATGEDGTASFYSYRIGPDGRRLTPVDSVWMGGVKDPCHVRLLDGGRIVAAACYGDGRGVWCRVGRDGRFEGEVRLLGGERPEGAMVHAHQVAEDRDGRWVYVTDLGRDRVEVFRVAGGELVHHSVVELAEGSGPRHCAFSPDGRRMAVVCELNSTVVILGPDEEGIFNRILQAITTLPPEGGRCAAADIHYSTDGSRLWASERGVPAIVCYDVDGGSGLLSPAGRIVEGVNWPRGFAVVAGSGGSDSNSGGEWLLVANQEGDNVSLYQSVPGARPVSSVGVRKPSCVVVR